MALRTNNGQYARRTASLPAVGAFTMCGWIRTTYISGVWQFWGLENATESASAWLLLGWSNFDSVFFLSTTAGNSTFTAPANEQWCFWALINESGVNEARARLYRLGSDTAFQTVSVATAETFTPALLSLGNDSYDEYMDGAYANVKVWDAVLTDAELYQEMWSTRPRRTANLHLWSPLFVDSKDYSGNGKDWTEGGSPTYEDGPPVGWGAPTLVYGVGGAGTNEFSYTGTGGVVVAGAGSRVIAQVYAPITQAVRLAGTATRALVKTWLAAAAGVILAGSATTAQSHQFTYSALTQDVKLAGSATRAVEYVYAPIAQDVRLAGAGTSVFINAHYYTGTGGVIVDSAGSWSKTKVAPVTTQDILIAGSATWTIEYVYVPILVGQGPPSYDILRARGGGSWTKTKAYSSSGGVIVSGAGTRVLENVYSPITQDIIVTGSVTVAKVKAATVTTADIRVAGAAALAIVYVYTPITQDIILSGSATRVLENVYTAITADIVVSGTAARAVVKNYTATGGVIVAGAAARAIEYVYVPIAQDIIVDSAGSYSFVGQATHTYDGTGGVIVAGAGTLAVEQVYEPSGGVRVAGTADPPTLERVYAAITQDLIVSGAATVARVNVYEYTAETSDVRLAGAAATARARVYAVQTQDLLASGTAALAVEYVYAVQTQDVLLDSQGTYQLVTAGAFVYDGTGGVIVAGAGSVVFEQFYAPVTVDLHVSGSASLAVEKVATVATSDIKLAGSSEAVNEYAYNVLTADVRLSGAATVAAEKAYSATGGVIVAGTATRAVTFAYVIQAQDVVVSGAGTYARQRAYPYTAVTQDVILGGTASKAIEYLYTAVTADIIVSGSARLAVEQVYAVITAAGILDSQGTYQFITTGVFTYTGTGGVVVAGASTQTIEYVYVPIIADIRVAGTAGRAIEYVYATVTTDIRISGTATTASENAYSVQTQDVIAAGSATIAAVKGPAVAAQDVRLDSQGIYSFQPVGASTYAGSGGVVVDGIATTVSIRAFYYTAQTQDVRLGGTSGPATQEEVYAVLTQDVLVTGSGAWARARAYQVVTQDVVLAGAGTWARTIGPTIATQDIRLAGVGAVTFEQQYAVVTADIRVSGTADRAKVRVYGPVTQPVVVTGAGSYIYAPVGAHLYPGTGGVILGGSYWNFGDIIRFRDLGFTVTALSPAFSNMEFSVAWMDEIEMAWKRVA